MISTLLFTAMMMAISLIYFSDLTLGTIARYWGVYILVALLFQAWLAWDIVGLIGRAMVLIGYYMHAAGAAHRSSVI